MVHGNIIKQGLYGDSKQPVKAGMPVAIKNVDGKGVIVPYSVTDNAFIGVAIEDTIVYDVFRSVRYWTFFNIKKAVSLL